MSAHQLCAGDHGGEQHGGLARGLPCALGWSCCQQTPPAWAQGALCWDRPWGAWAAVGLGSAGMGLLGMETREQGERQGCKQGGV